MTTLKLYGGDLGRETLLVRCDLTRAEAPVEVNYLTGQHGDCWGPTQYQCADCRHRVEGLESIARELAARAVEIPPERFTCEV